MTENTPDEPAEAIMRATYCALCEHGYADLTMQDIADEAGKSTAALHYHYDTKRDLLVAFLDHLLEELRAELDGVETEDPVERVHAFVDAMFERSEREEGEEFRTAILEVRAQAPYDERFRERLEAFDRYNRAYLREAVAEGIDRGVFDAAVDPADAAAFVVNAVRGAHTSEASLGQSPGPVERTLRRYVDDHLRTDTDEARDGATATAGEVSPE